MAVEHGYGRIVTDGLVLCLDAADNNSYPGSGNTWTDLSGQGNNGTLVNGPTFNSGNKGSLDFDGTNDHVRITSNDWAKSGEDITVLCNLKREGISEDGTDYSLSSRGAKQQTDADAFHCANRCA